MKNNLDPNSKLQRAIIRTNHAYELYLDGRMYYQALRIKHANIEVYELLKMYLYVSAQDDVDGVLNYMYHLEDWFIQFEWNERNVTSLEDPFCFENLSKPINYPQNFIHKLLKI